MAFPYSGSGAGMNVQVETGPDLEEIQTDTLGFLALGGERKVRLLPSTWPSSALPPPTASLLSVASGKGLVAAANPDTLVVAGTDSIRAAFSGSSASGDVVPYEPQLKIPLPMRISQVAFSADEAYLVISAEQGGGLAVYNVDALMQGITTFAFELATNAVALRALCPNPAADKAHLFALVTANGDLLVANLKDRQFVNGPNGQVLRQGVSCVSWSTRGKQLVAGMADGTVHQMTPEGEIKAEIPRPPSIIDDQLVSSLYWLENHLFLVAHTPKVFDADTIPSTTFHLVSRQPPSSYGFQKLNDPCFPAGLNRSPPHHFISRLKDFPPNLPDLLILASTVSTDVGMITRSQAPLTSEAPAANIVNVFTTTGVADDSRRAQLSMTEDAQDTSPIGLAVDLSSKAQVPRPLPREEMDQSPTPLPALFIMNNEGVLAAWWIVYSDSIKQGTAYPGLVAAGPAPAQAGPKSPPRTQQLPPALAPSPSFGLPPALSNPSSTPAGAPQSSSSLAFGSTTGLGAKPSPWGSPSSAAAPQGMGSSWGKPVFGSTTPLGAQASTFGQPGNLGTRESPWANLASSQGSGFNQPSPFGSALSAGATASPSSGGGFTSYASQGGFAAAAASNPGGQSIFASAGAGAPLALSSTTQSIFGAPKAANPTPSAPLSRLGATGFQLGSTFKGDGTAKDDAPKPAGTSSGGLFAAGPLDAALDDLPDASKEPPSQEAEMPPAVDEPHPAQATKQPDTDAPAPATPPSNAPASASSKPGVGGTFGTEAQSEKSPAMVEQSRPATLPFETPPRPKEPESPHTPLQQPPGPSTPQLSSQQPASILSPEPKETKGESTPEPIPPVPTSKNPCTVGDSSIISERTAAEDAPLPPDFVKREGSDKTNLTDLSAPTPSAGDGEDVEEDGDGDWDDSGEDVGHDLSPPEGPGRSVKLSRQSSFNDAHDHSRSPVGGSFTEVSKPSLGGHKPLFGEIGTFPLLPPPTARPQSPRSPSPIRSLPLTGRPRLENPRSVSLPGRAPRFGAGQGSNLSRLNPLRDIAKGQASKAEEPDARSMPPAAKPDGESENEDWVDAEGEAIRAELSAPVKGRTTLPPFKAHHDYVGHIKSSGLAGPIERLCYDVNSMVDTLGLNAKAVTSFVKGHTEHAKSTGRQRDDLEDDSDWCLVEITELSRLEDETMDRLEDGRIQNVREKFDTLKDFRHDIAKLRMRFAALKKTTDALADPAQTDGARAAPLNGEMALQQREIRAEALRVQRLLVQAEESVTLLKTKLASVASRRGADSNGASTASVLGAHSTPSVDAVVRTIMKLTSMAQKKSGDVDVLECQLRELRMDENAAAEDVAGAAEARLGHDGNPTGDYDTDNVVAAAAGWGMSSSSSRGSPAASAFMTPRDPRSLPARFSGAGNSESNGGSRTPLSRSTHGGGGGGSVYFTPDSSPGRFSGRTSLLGPSSMSSSSLLFSSQHHGARFTPSTGVGGGPAALGSSVGSLGGSPASRRKAAAAEEALRRSREANARKKREVGRKLAHVLMDIGPRVRVVTEE